MSIVKMNEEYIEFVKSDSDRCSIFLNVSKNKIDECDIDDNVKGKKQDIAL